MTIEKDDKTNRTLSETPEDQAQYQQAFEQRLADINPRIDQACLRSGRVRNDVRLLPVSKTVEASRLRLACKAGCRQFGGNMKTFDCLRVRGLMTLAVFSASNAIVRECFVRMHTLRDRLQQELPDPAMCQELSMGMSGDFEIAIEEGSTCVRVGQALFGPRALPDSYYWPGEVS